MPDNLVKRWEWLFKLRMDLFDYGSDDIGKPRGIDIKEKKLTLPLIYTLSKANWGTRRKIINIVKNDSENSKKIQEVISIVKNSGGIQYATEVMHKFKNEALAMLKSFPESESRNALEGLVTYTIERKK